MQITDKKEVLRTCLNCGAEFYSNHPTKKYCKLTCGVEKYCKDGKEARVKARETIKVQCRYCGSVFNTHKTNKISCSDKCAQQFRDRNKPLRDRNRHIDYPGATCYTCKKDFKPATWNNKKYCSPECRRASRDGDSGYKTNATACKRVYTEEEQRQRTANNLAVRRHRLKNWYGITPEQYVELLKSQGYKCAICRKDLDMGKDTHIDHAHYGDRRVRGALCSSHNSALGMFNDSIEVLQNAIKYLQAYNPKLEELARQKLLRDLFDRNIEPYEDFHGIQDSPSVEELTILYDLEYD